MVPQFADQPITVINIPHNRLKAFAYRVPKNGPHTQSAIRAIREFQPQVIHFHTIYGLSKVFLGEIVRLGIPFVITLHDHYLACPRIYMMDKWGDVCRSVVLSKCERCIGALEQVELIRKLARLAKWDLPTVPSYGIRARMSFIANVINNAKLVLSVSTRVEEIFREVYPEGKYRTVHIGNASALAGRVSRERSDKIRLAFLGTLTRHKGGDLFLELIDYCRVNAPNIEFHFYGRAGAQYGRELSHRGVQDHGPYKEGDIPKIMAKTDMGVVVPIWEDNGPQVVMEILNSGTPIVATKVGGIVDFVNDECGILFHPDEPLEKHAAFRRIAALNHQIVERMGRAVPRLKSPSEHASELLAIYKEVISHE